MIKLASLLEAEEKHIPFMHSPKGFSCHVCKFLYEEDGVYHCDNTEYQEYRGTSKLVDDQGNEIKKTTEWCSDWFEPKTK